MWTRQEMVFFTLSEDEERNAQQFWLRPAALWEMQVENLQVGVWTQGWLCVNRDDVKPHGHIWVD